ncbi:MULTISPECIES: DUF2909 family protein [Candidatus Ichthyocystis]|uniref:DUF2909 family protein n=1 Tax=Candidatus Ichthyocystis TaxID=2929841 RepID=UPI000B88F8DC|nr:DUF2909 family protein [Candidatus Ichthyocystis sparus]
MRLIIIAIMVSIVGSLGSAIFQLFRREKSKKFIYILATRMILSISLFTALIVMYKMGIIRESIK